MKTRNAVRLSRGCIVSWTTTGTPGAGGAGAGAGDGDGCVGAPLSDPPHAAIATTLATASAPGPFRQPINA